MALFEESKNFFPLLTREILIYGRQALSWPVQGRERPHPFRPKGKHKRIDAPPYRSTLQVRSSDGFRGGSMFPPLSKVQSLHHLRAERLRLKAAGKKIVFTNGCFDILHPGHTRYLQEARSLGDFLIVAVNSDRSVRAIKGPERPVFPEEVRAELLAALASVDAVVIFDEDNPLKVIQALVPDVLVKGGDWAEDRIIGADVVKAAGGEVRRIPYITGYSTTEIIRKIRGQNP
jgi:D-beta-D-heptose 7-phosphate kinase/D-beta-D-heptose 1-phosphate adenosyltransferase